MISTSKNIWNTEKMSTNKKRRMVVADFTLFLVVNQH